MELLIMMRKIRSSYICILFLFSLSLFTHQCEARISKEQFFKEMPTNDHKLKNLKHIDMDYPPPLGLPNPQSYGVGSPFNLPPFDSLAPTPLPENPFCEYPPGLTPLPPITIPTPPTTGYTSPPIYLSPLLPYQSPPQSPSQSPPFNIPSPPDSSIPNPPESVPSPSGDLPMPPSPPSPPESVPSPSGDIPSPSVPSPFTNVPNPPPQYVPSPIGYMPSPPIGNEPSPPVYAPSPPEYEPSPPGYGLSPPVYFPSPTAFVPNPPGGGGSGYVPSPLGGGGGYVPSPPVFQPPVVFPPPRVPPSSSKGPGLTLWCVAKPSVPDPIIEEAMNYACGSGADCGSIQPQGSCYQPETLFAHASFAFNSYWQRTKAAGGTCDFGGTAILVTLDPSFDGCHFIAT